MFAGDGDEPIASFHVHELEILVDASNNPIKVVCECGQEWSVER